MEGQTVERVSELFTATGAWNEEFVKEIFIAMDAEAILQIPVLAQGADFGHGL